MKKNLLIYILLSMFIFIPKVYAEEFEIDEATGKYIVSEGRCSYAYIQKGFGSSTNYGFEIVIKDNKLSSIEDVSGYASLGKYGELAHYNSLKFNNFFEKSGKEFSCPEKVYVNYLAMPSGGARQGFNLEAACDAETLGLQCHEAKYIENSGIRRYVTKDASKPNTETKKSTLRCSYKKTTGSGGSQNQSDAPNSLIYNKYSDNTSNFTTNTNEKYEISSGELTECSTTIYTNFENGKFKIVSSCSDGANGKCVIYGREDTVTSIDTSINEDGTTSNETAADVVNPDNIAGLEPSTVNPNLDFKPSSCDTLLGEIDDKNAPAYYLNFAFNLIKYAAIIMLLVLTIVEYVKAVAASNQDAIKKATQTTIKRLIIAIIIFFLPLLINFILRVLGIISTHGTCGIGI